MNQQERYLFDLKGYVIVRDALTPEQVKDLSDRLERQRDRRREAMSKAPVEEVGDRKGRKTRKVGVEHHLGSDRTILGSSGTAWSSPSMLEWGGSYIDLIDLPTIAPYPVLPSR